MVSKKAPEAGEAEQGIRGVVRIAGKDLPGQMPLVRALMYVKGIGHSLRRPVAMFISKKMGIPMDVKIGTLTYEQVEEIDRILSKEIHDGNFPAFLLNRRKDMETGKNLHLITNELDLAVRQDIARKKKNGSWQGYRHKRGKKVRGQKTAYTGRKNLTVGVSKKKS